MSTFWIVTVVFISLLFVVIGGLYLYWVILNRRFSVVEKGRVYRSGALRPALLQKKVQQLGIRTVIDFRREKGKGRIQKEKDFLEQLGVQHIHLRSRQVPGESTVKNFLKIMNEQENYPVLLHCSHGRGRACLFSAIYLMEYLGRSKILTCVSLFWNPLLGSFNPLSNKGRFILNYSPMLSNKESDKFPIKKLSDTIQYVLQHVLEIAKDSTLCCFSSCRAP